MRLSIIRSIYLTIILLVIIRLGFWQTVQGDVLSSKAEAQRTDVQQIIAPRGSIYFSDGSLLAGTQPMYQVYALPKEIASLTKSQASLNAYKTNFAEKVAQLINQEKIEREATTEAEKQQIIDNAKMSIFDKLSKDLFWISLGNKVNLYAKKSLENLSLDGLGFQNTNGRFYPEGSSSAHLLGFVAADPYSNEKGYFGLEGFYDGELRGRNGVVTQEKDAMGLPILIGKYNDKQAKDGNDVTLHVDRTVQHIVEEKLQQGMEKYGAKSASAVVVDPKTGDILAMASYPGYDPGYTLIYPKENFKNPITVDGYEPGSTFKVMVMASAISEGLIKRDTVCDICAGPVQIAGFNIRTWNNQYNPGATMDDVIIHSDNTGMVFVSRKLGIDKMYDYIDKFGFGKLTGIDVQDEYTPVMRDKNDWKDIDLATASFGQGISVTPIQVVRAVGAIANGGKLMEPHIAWKIKSDQKTYTIEPRVISQPITEQAAKDVTEMMVRAVNEGEAKFARTKGYRVAGKTGTAQIPVAGHYDATKTIASFVGFAPADDPKFVMLVMYNSPSSSIYGAETAAPTFFNIAKELFTYYGIPPTGE